MKKCPICQTQINENRPTLFIIEPRKIVTTNILTSPSVSVKEECGGPGGALPFDDFKEEDLKGDLGDFGNGDYYLHHGDGLPIAQKLFLGAI